MRRARLVMVMTLACCVAYAGGLMASPAQQKVPHDAAYRAAREHLADLLASEEVTKVEVASSSFDEAMQLIYTTVDTYLGRAVGSLGVKDAEEYGVEIIRGLEDHDVHYADQDGLELVGEQRVLISNEDQARQLGELLARVADLIHEGHGGRGVNIRSAARKIFEGMLPTRGTGESLATQYLVRLRLMTDAEKRALVKYATE